MYQQPSSKAITWRWCLGQKMLSSAPRTTANQLSCLCEQESDSYCASLCYECCKTVRPAEMHIPILWCLIYAHCSIMVWCWHWRMEASSRDSTPLSLPSRSKPCVNQENITCRCFTFPPTVPTQPCEGCHSRYHSGYVRSYLPEGSGRKKCRHPVVCGR